MEFKFQFMLVKSLGKLELRNWLEKQEMDQQTWTTMVFVVCSCYEDLGSLYVGLWMTHTHLTKRKVKYYRCWLNDIGLHMKFILNVKWARKCIKQNNFVYIGYKYFIHFAFSLAVVEEIQLHRILNFQVGH